MVLYQWYRLWKYTISGSPVGSLQHRRVRSYPPCPRHMTSPPPTSAQPDATTCTVHAWNFTIMHCIVCLWMWYHPGVIYTDSTRYTFTIYVRTRDRNKMGCCVVLNLTWYLYRTPKQRCPLLFLRHPRWSRLLRLAVTNACSLTCPPLKCEMHCGWCGSIQWEQGVWYYV